MSLFSVLKRNSKLALRNNWGKAILVLLITLAASFALSILQNIAISIFAPFSITYADIYQLELGLMTGELDYSSSFVQLFLQAAQVELIVMAVFSVLSIFLMGPVELGYTRWHFALVHGRSTPLSEVFRFFESFPQYLRSLWYSLQIAVRHFLWSIPFLILPTGMFVGCIYLIAQNPDDRAGAALATMGMLFSSLLLLLASILFVAFMNRYMLVPYLLCRDESLTVNKAFRLSVQYTKGYRFSLLGFSLTFLGWMLLCFFFFPILYVYPYMNTAFAMYARYIIEKREHAMGNATREFPVGGAPGQDPTGDGGGY